MTTDELRNAAIILLPFYTVSILFFLWHSINTPDGLQKFNLESTKIKWPYITITLLSIMGSFFIIYTGIEEIFTIFYSKIFSGFEYKILSLGIDDLSTFTSLIGSILLIPYIIYIHISHEKFRIRSEQLRLTNEILSIKLHLSESYSEETYKDKENYIINEIIELKKYDPYLSDNDNIRLKALLHIKHNKFNNFDDLQST